MSHNLHLDGENTMALVDAIEITIKGNKSGTKQAKVAKKLANLNRFRNRLYARQANDFSKADWDAIMFALKYAQKSYSHTAKMLELNGVDPDDEYYVNIVDRYTRLVNLLAYLADSVALEN